MTRHEWGLLFLAERMAMAPLPDQHATPWTDAFMRNALDVLCREAGLSLRVLGERALQMRDIAGRPYPCTTKRGRRKARQRRARLAVELFEADHPRAEATWPSADFPGPQWAWHDLISHWWTAAEWLARWRRLPARDRRYRRCPPRPWINPARITLRAGRHTRRLP